VTLYLIVFETHCVFLRVSALVTRCVMALAAGADRRLRGRAVAGHCSSSYPLLVLAVSLLP
jgi:hypothetical protein